MAVTDVDESDLRPDGASDLRRRIPEIDALSGNVRDEVIHAFCEDVPGYFWVVRASKSYHPPDERGVGGLWLHTRRVFTAYVMIEPTYRAMSHISQFESNCARAAVLLHDACKYGYHPEQIGSDESDHGYADGLLDHLPIGYDEHDVEMAQYIRTSTELPEEVARTVESHGGSADWFSHAGPSPSDPLEMLVHIADMYASNEYHGLPVLAGEAEMPEIFGIHDVDTVQMEDVVR